ncbi:MAG: baseplate J/gp47 family protein [Synergistaceae bacterium]|nr:baseplate J/gp47 family protein [Synergistaceae bacterium]
MAGLKRFSYIDKDHASIVADCIARIKEVYGEEAWNDFEEDNSGVMLVEAFAYIADLLLFYLDRQANEVYLPTATERQNLINLCKLIAYNPSGAKAAQANITVSIKEARDSDVTLSKGAQIETQNGVMFETQDDAVIKAGELSCVVGAIEGETHEDIIGSSNGEAFQEFYLPLAGVIEVVSLTVGEHEWDAADSIADHTPSDKIYMAELDAWGRVRITFGDGVSGQIPREDERISVVYRVGGGVRGNVAPNTLTTMREIALDEQGNNVPVSVTNLNWASGGAEPQSAESIKQQAPLWFATQKRCVTQSDYESFAVSFNSPEAGAIAKAHAVVRERSGEANIIRYYVLTYGEQEGSVALASQALKDALREYISEYQMLTDWIEVEDGKWREINFKGVITISPGLKAGIILDKVEDTLKSLMNIETREMGEALRISDAYAAIDNIEGVEHVELESPSATIEADNNELLILGEINFSFKIQGSGMNGKNF